MYSFPLDFNWESLRYAVEEKKRNTINNAENIARDSVLYIVYTHVHYYTTLTFYTYVLFYSHVNERKSIPSHYPSSFFFLRHYYTNLGRLMISCFNLLSQQSYFHPIFIQMNLFFFYSCGTSRKKIFNLIKIKFFFGWFMLITKGLIIWKKKTKTLKYIKDL